MLWDTSSVLVLPTPFVKGMDNPEDDIAFLRRETLQKALETKWQTDAHFVSYVMVDRESGKPYPHQCRVNKPALGKVRERGVDVVTETMVFDFDLPGHAKWSPEAWDKMGADWDAAIKAHPLVGRTAALYTTRGGFRAVYLLPKPVPVDVVEPMLKAMVAIFASTALAPYIDRRCWDWTRLFRLPRVIREGASSEDSPFFSINVEADVDPIISTELPADLDIAGKKQYGQIVRVDRALDLGPEQAKAMLRTPDGKPSEWLKEASGRLRGRDTLDFILGKRKIEETGQRNNTLQKLVGSTVSLLIYIEGTTPQQIYALWVDAVEQLEARTGKDNGRGWLDILWEMVCRTWEKEASAVVTKKSDENAVEAKTEKLSEMVLTGMRAWCKHPFLHASDADGYLFVQRHAIVTYGGDRYHVLRADGYYDPQPISLVNLPGRVRELGMDTVIELTWLDEEARKPKVKPVPLNVLLMRHSTLVSAREGAVGTEGSYIRNIEGDSATFVFKMYARRTDLFPEYDADVDGWLRAFAGDDYSKLCAWIGHALNFEGGPICALSIDGPPGVGKKMLVEGLAECVDTQTVADAKEMTGRFQAQILRTPFLVVNEGLPRVGRDAATDPADSFRSLVAGDTLHVEEKGKGIITVRNPMRVIITANNAHVLGSLYRHRDLSPSDREALGRRLLHLTLQRDGVEWLTARGGKNFTGRPGRRWIRGDDGSPSDLVVAKHFFWLYKNRPPVPKGNRFLVEGDPESWIVREMAVASGGSGEVIESILGMLDQATKCEGLFVEECQVFVTAAGVRDFHATVAKFKGSVERMSLHRIGSVLHGLCARGWKPEPRAFDGGPRMRWWLIDLDILLTMAEQFGHTCRKLRTLITERDERRGRQVFK